MHVFPTFDIGGVQVRFAALADALGARYRHTVVALNGEYGAAALIATDAPVRYAQAPAKSGSRLGRLGKYRALLAELRPDLLITHNWGSIEVILANALVGLPHMHLEDGFGPEEADRQLPRRVWARRIALARSRVIVPSRTLEAIATRIWRLDRRRVQYIANGVAPLAESSVPLQSLGLDLPAGRPVIVWAGALRAEKNPLRLLRAFAPLKDRAVLVLIGDGPERDAVEQEAARLELGRGLHMLGRRTDTRDIIMHAQMLALSSDTEQMPLVVLEAMEAGLPVVSTDVGDVRDMVARENRDFVVAAHDDAALTAALDALVRDAALRARIGEANRARQQKHFALSQMADAYAVVFDGLTAASRG